MTSLHHHPLAMDARTVHRLCAESLTPGGFTSHRAVVIPFERPTPAELLAAASSDYLALTPAQRLPGTIYRLATERGLNFHQLLHEIGEQQSRRG